ILAQPKFGLFRQHVSECSVHRLSHGAAQAPCGLELSRSMRGVHFDPVQARVSRAIHRGGINATRSWRIGGDHVPATLFWHSNKPFFARLLELIAERGLV